MTNNKPNIAIVSAPYRKQIVDGLVQNCLKTLKQKGLTSNQIKLFEVPGSLEIPLVSKKIAQSKKYDAIIAFGAVFKGKTYHFEQVADECVRGCMNVSYDYEIPVVFEVLCVYDPQDALDRAIGTEDNRGVEGALTVLAMIETLKQF